MSQPSQSVPSIGFYSVEHSEHLGWIGGYLILNASGRPLEFHCTLPIRPSRTHEILYGASLKQYLVGEAIPTALMKQAKNSPLLLCSDCTESLSLADRVGIPVALIDDPSATGEPRATRSLMSTKLFETPRGIFRAESRFERKVHEALEKLAELPDLAEPFTRIREAIREAQQQGAVPHSTSQPTAAQSPGAKEQSGSRAA